MSESYNSSNVPSEDEMDLITNNFNPSHGEAYIEPENIEPERASDREDSYGPKPMDNLARSDLRPDLHPSDLRYYGQDDDKKILSDEDLLRNVRLALKQSREIDSKALAVCVKDGLVYIQGEFPSDGIKRVAFDLIESVPGVIDVFYTPVD